jgi:hypothetical protein
VSLLQVTTFLPFVDPAGTQDTTIVISPFNVKIHCHSLVLCVWSDTFRSLLKGKGLEEMEEDDEEDEALMVKKAKKTENATSTTSTESTAEIPEEKSDGKKITMYVLTISLNSHTRRCYGLNSIKEEACYKTS